MVRRNEVEVTFKAFNQEFNKAMKEMGAETSKLKQEMKLQEEQMKHSASESEKLEARISNLQKQYELVQRKTKETAEQLEKAKQQFGENSAEVARMEKELKRAEIAEQQLANRIIETTNKLQEVANAERERTSETVKAAQKIKELVGTEQQLQSSMSKLSAEYDLQKAKLGQNASEAEQLRLKMDHLGQAHTIASNQVRNLEQQLEQAKAQYGANSAEVQKYETKLLQAQTAEQKVANEIKQTESALNKQKQSFNDLQNLLQVTGAKLEDFASAISPDLANAINKGTASTKQLDQAFDLIAKSAVGASADVDKLKNTLRQIDSGVSLDGVKKEFDEISKASKEAAQDVNEFGGELESVVGGLAAGGGLAAAVTAALDTSSLNTKIEISMDVPPESIQSVKSAIKQVESYGVDAESAMEGVRRQWALNKDATDENNAAVTALAGTIVAAFGEVDFTELIQESNEIAGTLEITNEEALGLVDTLLTMGFPPEQIDIIAEYGDQMKQAGFTAEEIQAIMAAGVDTSTWNIDNLLDGVKEGRIKMAEFGAEVPQSMKDIIAKTDLSASQFQKWGQAIAGGGEKGQAAMLEATKALAGVKNETVRNELGVAMFGTMWEDQGRKIADTIINSKDKMVDLGVGVDNLTSKMETLNQDPLVTLRQAFTDMMIALDPFLTKISEVTQKFAEWVQNNPQLAATIAAIASIIGILVGAFGFLMPAIAGLISVWPVLAGAMSAIMGPVGLIIAGIALLATIIIANWDSIWAATQSAWTATMDFLSSTWDSIKSTASSAWDSLTTYLASTWDSIVATAQTVWNGLTSFFTQWGPTILAVITGPIGMLVSLIIKNWDTIKSTTQSVWNGIKSFLSSLWNAIKSLASSTWNGIKTAISTISNAIKTVITTVWNAIKSVTTMVWNGIKTIITTIWTAIKSTITTVVNAIKSVVTTVWNAIKSTITSVLNSIKSVVTSVWNAIKSVVTSVLNAIKSVVTSVWNAIKSVISSAMNGIKSVITSGWNAAKSVVTSSVNAIKSIVTRVFNSLKSVVASAMNGVKSAIVNGWNAAKSFLQSINLVSIGKNIIQGLIRGISSMMGEVSSAISNIANKIKSGIKNALKIKSPSRVMRDEVGVWIPAGIAEGMNKNVGVVREAAKRMADAAIPDISGMEIRDKTNQLFDEYKFKYEMDKMEFDEPQYTIAGKLVVGKYVTSDGITQFTEYLDEANVLVREKGDKLTYTLYELRELLKDAQSGELANSELESYYLESLPRIIERLENGEVTVSDVIEDTADEIENDTSINDALKKQLDEQKKLLKEGIQQVDKFGSELMKALSNKYKTELEASLARTTSHFDKLLNPLEEELAALDEKFAAEDKSDKMSDLQANLAKARTEKDRKKIQKLIDAENKKMQREQQKESIKAEIDEIEATKKVWEDKIKAKYETLMSQEAIENEARKLILEGNEEEIIELLESHNPHWQDAGRSFGEKLVEGLKSMSTPIKDAVESIVDIANGTIAQLKETTSLALANGLSLNESATIKQLQNLGSQYRPQDINVDYLAKIQATSQPIVLYAQLNVDGEAIADATLDYTDAKLGNLARSSMRYQGVKR